MLRMMGLVGRLTAPRPSTPAGGAGPSPLRAAKAGFRREGLNAILASRCGLPTKLTAFGRAGASAIEVRAGKVLSELMPAAGAVAGGKWNEGVCASKPASRITERSLLLRDGTVGCRLCKPVELPCIPPRRGGSPEPAENMLVLWRYLNGLCAGKAGGWTSSEIYTAKRRERGCGFSRGVYYLLLGSRNELGLFIVGREVYGQARRGRAGMRHRATESGPCLVCPTPIPSPHPSPL